MSRMLTDLESIIEPIAVLFRRARLTNNLDVSAPTTMMFDENNSITLVWNLSDLSPEEAFHEFTRIRELADTDFTRVEHDDVGIITYSGNIVWHGEYPDVAFRVVMSKEVSSCPNLTGNLSASS